MIRARGPTVPPPLPGQGVGSQARRPAPCPCIRGGRGHGADLGCLRASVVANHARSAQLRYHEQRGKHKRR